MAKCAKCERRKGKRHCPALEGGICPQCCAEHRLNTIACPKDCSYLQAEYYQLERRAQKARSEGKRFLASIQKRFFTEESRQFAFQLQADCYWWMDNKGVLSNAEVLRALEELGESLSPVHVPRGRPHPLGEFLGELLKVSKRYTSLERGNFKREHVGRVIAILAESLREQGDGESDSFYREIESYFGQLDFEADLDYSPTEELKGSRASAPPGYEERRSGLIVPE